MADEKVRIGFDGRPLAAPTRPRPDGDVYVESTLYVTKDGRRAVEGKGGRFYLAGGDGRPRLDQPIDKDQLA